MATKETNELIKELAEAISNTTKNQNDANVAAIEINRKVTEKQLQQQNYANRISAEMSRGINCVNVAIPKIYYQYQPSFVISINGCTIKLPSDGVARTIHKDFYLVLQRRLKALDDKIENMRSGKSDIRQIN